MSDSSGGQVQTAATCGVMKTEHGATLTLRKAKSSDQTRLAASVKWDFNNQSSTMELTQRVVQWGITDAQGLLDEHGNPVKFGVVPCPSVAVTGTKIASEAVYDALTTEDVTAIFKYVYMGTPLTEAQRGN